MNSNLRGVLQRLAQDADAPRISAVGQVAVLKEGLERYRARCPYRIGDFVTPRRDTAMRGQGEPHLVVDLLDIGRVFNGDPGSNVFGVKPDMTVLHVESGGLVVGYCVESWMFEPWVNPEEKPAARAATSPKTPSWEG